MIKKQNFRKTCKTIFTAWIIDGSKTYFGSIIEKSHFPIVPMAAAESQVM